MAIGGKRLPIFVVVKGPDAYKFRMTHVPFWAEPAREGADNLIASVGVKTITDRAALHISPPLMRVSTSVSAFNLKGGSR